MKTKDQVYRQLQRHLDKQAVGFPATRSGVELKILKHIFTTKEARIVSHLSFKPETVATIYKKIMHLVESAEELHAILDNIKRKGGIEEKIINGANAYCCVPLVVGMYELQNNRLTPGFIEDFNKYTSTKKFGIEFLSANPPQMRTIPIAKSIRQKQNVSNFDEISKLLMEAEGPFAITECICRKKSTMEGKACKVTDRKETCLGVGSLAKMSIANGFARKITRQEAISIIEQNQKDGLVLQPSNTKKAEFICSCCGCCCGMLSFQKHLPKPVKFWAANYYAVADEDKCIGCGVCEKKCQVQAIKIDPIHESASINLDRCIGCGICVVNCPNDSLSLAAKTDENVPPQTREELYEIIMGNKKGPLQKFRVTGTLIVDSIQARMKNPK